MVRILAGDIGGTNSRLVLYETGEEQTENKTEKEILGGHVVVSQVYYKNNDYVAFTQILSEFLSQEGNNGPVKAACFAVAGPVANNRINFTNREGWIIDAQDLKSEFPIESVQLINDFVANGYGLLALKEDDCEVLQEGRSDSQLPIALVGAGTGLGECFLAPGENGVYTAYPSEGGHVEFAPKSELEEELLHYLQDKTDTPNSTDNLDSDPRKEKPRISVERVVSGGGLENIYDFMTKKYPDEVNSGYDKRIRASPEKGRIISALKYDYVLCKLTLEMMFKAYGSEVGNVALKFMPYGGLYIAGGIAPKNLEYINSPSSQFMKAFWDKGRMRTIMSQFPVYVVKKEDIGLRGAHVVAARAAAEKQGLPVGKKEQGPSAPPPLPSGLSNFSSVVGSYPLTWAFASTISAALTATAIVSVSYMMANKNR